MSKWRNRSRNGESNFRFVCDFVAALAVENADAKRLRAPTGSLCADALAHPPVTIALIGDASENPGPQESLGILRRRARSLILSRSRFRR